MDISTKMAMSLDDIILQEKTNKLYVRANQCEKYREEEDNKSVQTGGRRPIVRMASPRNRHWFRNHPTYNSRLKFNQRQWSHNLLRYKCNMSHCNQLMKKRRCFGIPLLNLKNGFQQGIHGNSNYNLKSWKSPFNKVRNAMFNRGQYRFVPLTARALHRFNRSNSPAPNKFRRGPGSASSGYSRRSGTSYKSYPSNKFNSSNFYNRPIRKFQCFLNTEIQNDIRNLQRNREDRISDSPRSYIRDRPSECKPLVTATYLPLHRRFQAFISTESLF